MNLRKQSSNLRIHQLQSLQNQIAVLKTQSRSKSRLVQKTSELRLLTDSANEKFIKLRAQTLNSKQTLASQLQSLKRALMDKQNQYQIKSRQNKRLSQQSAIQQIEQRMLLMQLNGQKQLFSQSMKEYSQNQRQLELTKVTLRQHNSLSKSLWVKMLKLQEGLSDAVQRLKSSKEKSDSLQEQLSLCQFQLQIEKQELLRLQELQSVKLSNYTIDRLTLQTSILQQVLRENRKDQSNINSLISSVQQQNRQLNSKHHECLFSQEEAQKKLIMLKNSEETMISTLQKMQKEINLSKLRKSRLELHNAKLRQLNEAMNVRIKGYKAVDSAVQEILASRSNKKF